MYGIVFWSSSFLNKQCYQPPSKPSPFIEYNYQQPYHRSSLRYNDLQFLNYRLDTEEKLSSLEEQVAILEGSSDATYNDDSPSAPAGISTEKMTAINMILSDKIIGWKAALRKILVIVLGMTELLQPCAKDTKNRPLDPILIQSITCTNIHLLYTFKYYVSIVFVDILYRQYGGSVDDLWPKAINTIINSACSRARRALKD